MKKNVHPDYNWVVIEDASSDFRILTRSTKKSDQKMVWTDGKEYPLITVEVSSASHPFYTGKQKIMDTGGRIDRFNRKYGKTQK